MTEGTRHLSRTETLLTRKLFVFSGEAVKSVLKVIVLLFEFSEFQGQTLVLTAGTGQVVRQLVHATLELSIETLGRLQSPGQLVHLSLGLK